MEGDLDEANEKEGVEAEISRAMRARVSDFKERADNSLRLLLYLIVRMSNTFSVAMEKTDQSMPLEAIFTVLVSTLTLEGVRRALEKDLGMKTFSLDAHKRFIKQCLDECFYGASDENLPKTSGATSTQSPKEEKSLSEENQPPSESRKDGSGFNKQIEGSPTTANKEALDHRIAHDQDSENDDVDEEKIRKAIENRADYFREYCMSISLAEVRRTLEEDLKLKTKALDAYKSFITNELDKVLQIPADVKPTNGVKKQPKKVSQKGGEKKPEKGIKRTRHESDSSNNNDSVTEDEEDEEIRLNKSLIGKDKAGKKGPKRLKKSKEDDKSPNSSEGKTAEQNSGNSSEDDGGNSSQDSHSHTSKGDSKKKQEKPVQVYGKRVEQLKSIIKSCGMSVPPTVYRKAKQVSESKREASLIKELEQILKKEGLTTNPSEKEIKAIKRKKERARELEGIDMSNIVSSSRRRTTSSYIPPPKPKIEVESESDEEDEENEEDTDENEDDGSGSEDPEEVTVPY
ncbi:hypothetical protein ZIOFF_010190 [Zingiber officinale]|uniref:Histone chaperone domain-containing protein n=1 Tax=Zingiber officinale TaxID=94328 RepID=A0A8J5HZ91_ZINOF|nr:hypothetical protein ZIOFF_010190 [Zingiber officinale]